MNRGVIVGGGLIAASFLVAVMLNRSAHEEPAPAQAVRQPSAHGCADLGQRQPTVVREGNDEKCTPAPADSAQR
ncbi:MAG TPA: hypothetical protein VH814_12870 [Steroidobacteraceae bacterium]|jgi:hypothetical protein